MRIIVLIRFETAIRPCALGQKETTRIQITRPTRTATSASSTLRCWDGDAIR